MEYLAVLASRANSPLNRTCPIWLHPYFKRGLVWLGFSPSSSSTTCPDGIKMPIRVTQSQPVYQDRFGKLQEHLSKLALLFRKLCLLCVEMTSDLQEEPSELVPYVGEEIAPVRVEPCSPAVNQERQEVLEKVRQKNQEMKILMDQMRNLLWDVIAMLTLRK